jgi:DNA-binding LacI/PurR family transcriptional regulator/signal transduction histidine kinase/ActR/RegA family two-component response regulator
MLQGYLPPRRLARGAASNVSRDSSKAGRLNIAVLLDHLNFFGRGYEGQLRDALSARCRPKGHNLLLLYGGALDAPSDQESADNSIFRILRPAEFDGVIVVSTLLSAYSGVAGVAALVERYKPARLCSIGAVLEGIPSFVLDNRVGIQLATEHLIHEHGCRRPAFLAGTAKNPEADARFQAYQDVLGKHGLEYHPDRVASGNFLPSIGRAAMDEILDRGIPFDAVVAANDSMAIGAIQALRRRGLRVPHDVPITGFDDLTLARLSNPPLTTVAQPFDVFADLAVACIEDQVEGRPVQAVTEIASQFVRRQSCGCGYREPGRGLSCAELPQLTDSSTDYLSSLKPVLASMVRSRDDDGFDLADRLCTGLAAEMAGETEAFQKAVGALLVDVEDSERHRTLQIAINFLRHQFFGDTDLQVERMFYDALSLVALSTTATQVRHRLDLDENYLRLLNVGEQAATAFDWASLRESLVWGLPAAGITTTLLSCLAPGPAAALESVLCFLDGAAIEPRPQPFPPGKLIPPEVLGLDRVSTLLVFPLVHERELLGVIAFDHHDGNNAYIAFRNQIAAVLKTIRLHQEVLRSTMLHERSVQERIATTQRLEALSVLAGGVAHDLNNALGPLLVIPDVILDQLGRLRVDEGAEAELRSDVETIKTAALRAAQTIKDLLTLGRQGRTPKIDLDLNRLIKSCMVEGLLHGGNSKVAVRVDLASESLAMRGAESQLARAVSNLVRNGMEAIEGRGEVTVKTRRVHLIEPITGFETVPPGWYAVLSISDTGCGIPPGDLGRVFEPFFTKKRAGENSGTGLGLAIVHGVVKEHDGFIDVTSTTSVGTTFTLYFPTTTASELGQDAPSKLPHGQARILVVDDEQVQLRTCRRVLTRLGYTVETSASGQLACEMFRQAVATRTSPFDLVLVDMLLGEAADGLEVIAQIHTMFPGQRAIIVSGHAPTERTEEASKHGVPWLAKPYSFEDLAQAVADALGNKTGDR